MSVSRQQVIVVGVDGSPESAAAAGWAAAEATRRHLTMRLIHGYSAPFFGSSPLGIPPHLIDGLRAAGRSVLDTAADEIRRTYPGVEVSTDLVSADPRSALIDASSHAVLTAVGTRGGARIPEVMLGSVALHVAAHGRSPVAVISRSVTPEHRGPILLGVDPSGNSEAAIAFAFDEAALRGTSIDAVLVWDDVADRSFARFVADIGQLDDEEEHAVLGEALAGWRDKYPDVSVRQVVLRGRPADVLLHFGADRDPALRAQLGVVGTRGRGGVAGVLLGSTSQALVGHASWPVVVVRRDTWS